MTKLYTHLTQEERYQVHAYKKADFSNTFIANELGRHVNPGLVNASQPLVLSPVWNNISDAAAWVFYIAFVTG